MSVFNVLQESQRATAALRMPAAGAPLKRGGRAALQHPDLSTDTSSFSPFII